MWVRSFAHAPLPRARRNSQSRAAAVRTTGETQTRAATSPAASSARVVAKSKGGWHGAELLMRIEMASHHFRPVKRRAAVTPQMQLLELLEELGVLRDDELYKRLRSQCEIFSLIVAPDTIVAGLNLDSVNRTVSNQSVQAGK